VTNINNVQCKVNVKGNDAAVCFYLPWLAHTQFRQ